MKQVFVFSKEFLEYYIQVGAEEGYISQDDVARLLKFRDNPSDESWIHGGKD